MNLTLILVRQKTHPLNTNGCIKDSKFTTDKICIIVFRSFSSTSNMLLKNKRNLKLVVFGMVLKVLRIQQQIILEKVFQKYSQNLNSILS